VRAGLALVVSATLAGVCAPASAYVIKRASSGRAVHWETARLEIEVAPDLVSGLGTGAIRAATRRAGRAWEGYGTPDFAVSAEAPPAQYLAGTPGVQIVRRAPWPHARRFLALTVTQYDDRTGRLLDADVLINPGKPIGDGPREFDLQTVLTHELGHVLGLGESDADSRATMWPDIPLAQTHQRTLADDDVRGIRAIYAGQALRSPGGCARASVAATSPLAWPLLLFFVALAWRAVRATGRRRGSLALAVGLFLLGLPAAAAPSPTRAPAQTVDVDPSFAGATALGPAEILSVRVGDDGLHRTTIAVDGSRVEVLGGCLDGVCQQVGHDAPPNAGESVLVAPATGAWARVEAGVAYGGWLSDTRGLRVSR